MILYHGTNISIENIDLEKCRPNKDFGKGFYLTDLRQQAEKMAKRVARIYGGNPIVNIYEIDDSLLDSNGLSVKRFDSKPSKEWATFVMNNRNKEFSDFSSMDCNQDNKFDIVFGPIANDDMAVLFRQYESQMITFDMLVSGLTFKELTMQCSFHSEKALSFVKKIGEIKL